MATTAQTTEKDHGASDQVLTTYELVEAILHHLPTKDLLLNQRVCHTWRDVIARSQTLQRALFFLPVKGGPLLNNWRFHEDLADLWASKDSATPMRIFRNQLLYPLHDICQDMHRRVIERRLPHTWEHSKASWRKMLLSPPGTVVFVDSPSYRRLEERDYSEATRAERVWELAEHAGMPRMVDTYWDEGMGNWHELVSNEQLEELPAEAT